MLDIYRFVLALLVLQAHLWTGGSPPLSQHAVFSFYVLSGFLMSLILNETYGFQRDGFLRFWLARALRLYPAYFVVVAMTAACVAFAGPLDQIYDLRIPSGAYALSVNLSMIGLAGFDFLHRPPANFVPNAWSLSIELFCYFLLSLGFARSVLSAALLLFVGIGVTLPEIVRVTIAHPVNYGFQDHYGVLQAGIIPFALGSLAYFTRHSRWLQFTSPRAALLIGLWVGNWLVTEMFDYHKFVSGLYVALAVNFVLVPMLFSYDRQGVHPSAKLIGGLAYPMFVCHIPVGSVLFLYAPFSGMNLPFFLVATAATIVVSLVIHLLIERRIETIRRLVKLRRPLPAPLVDHDFRRGSSTL